MRNAQLVCNVESSVEIWSQLVAFWLSLANTQWVNKQAYKPPSFVTGSEKRDHFALFHRFSRYHILATINKNGMMFGTVQVLTFS